MKTRKIIKLLSIVLAAGLALSLSGCMSVSIREDDVREELPVIDPEDGVAREIGMTCYYRLRGEDCLVAVERQVAVRAGERTELAVIRELMSGAPEENQSVEGLFIEGAEVTGVTLDEGILSVTLSSSFMSEIYYDIAEYEAKTALSNGEITQQECDARIAAALDELHTSRRLAVYSIVNTISGYGGNIAVQLIVESGSGTLRLTGGDIGIGDDVTSQFEPLGALSFDESYVATPELIMQYYLEHIRLAEYELAYRLISVTGDGMPRPTYADFQKDINSAGKLESFKITGVDAAGDRAAVSISMTFADAQGVKRTAECTVSMIEEDGFTKIGYMTFKEGLVSAG